MISRLKSVTIYVADQQQSRAFYVERLGFELRNDSPMGPGVRWIEVAPPGGDTTIVVYSKSMMPEWAGAKPSLIFHCADIAATHRELTFRGVHFSQEPKRMPWGTFAMFSDPDENTFVLMQDAAN